MEEHNTKHDQYALQKAKMKRAFQGRFFYEAMVIEYAILEDRSESVLQSVGKKITNRRGNPLRLTDKLNIINDDPSFQVKFIKQRLSRDLIENIRLWKQKRDALVHNLMNLSFYDESVEELAQEGKELVRVFDNKVRSVTRFLEKTKKDGKNI